MRCLPEEAWLSLRQGEALVGPSLVALAPFFAPLREFAAEIFCTTNREEVRRDGDDDIVASTEDRAVERAEVGTKVDEDNFCPVFSAACRIAR